jgi:hypothetical protein
MGRPAFGRPVGVSGVVGSDLVQDGLCGRRFALE